MAGDNGKRNPHKGVAIVSSVLFSMIGSMFGGLLLGYWADGHLGTTPFLLIVGLLLGMTAGFYGAYQVIKPFLGDDDK
ncbi:MULTISPECIES: AtpZ/AtpI family protein [Geomicrobium]|uniref:F0F1-type ATP synthase assembly protein I n=1 Tax=Geomicrobium sediminis TaxID=1347788 RepID=A0ABS2P7Z5_9BACL|nr:MULTISPECIES: AtpZ/AtpI family protein [Geomicrobium]EZH66235.1 hypothetical protein DH09_09875 [Bacillaceae bacterium JMAK1]MBM7631437.1 F0F1-type ATP synthase assembly protein I [Geomicrobium sediminis]GAJ97311.1 ATP synthase protein [Geomicrobium sp. JCM 19055]GAK07028.1 ATP synthase protein [Geomicrobium sp. JCM 19038]